MVNRQLSRLSLRCRVMLVVFAVITLPVELRVHATFARVYYDLYVKNLQLMALTAVKRGAEYLPADPRAAVRVADSYVQSQGIASAEIVFTELSSDNNMLTIGLDLKDSAICGSARVGSFAGASYQRDGVGMAARRRTAFRHQDHLCYGSPIEPA